MLKVCDVTSLGMSLIRMSHSPSSAAGSKPVISEGSDLTYRLNANLYHKLSFGQTLGQTLKFDGSLGEIEVYIEKI